MSDTDLINYFIEHTNKRFDKIEEKVDQLISFRLILIGSAMGVSGVISVIFHVAMAALNK